MVRRIADRMGLHDAVNRVLYLAALCLAMAILLVVFVDEERLCGVFDWNWYAEDGICLPPHPHLPPPE